MSLEPSVDIDAKGWKWFSLTHADKLLILKSMKHLVLSISSVSSCVTIQCLTQSLHQQAVCQ